MAITPVPGVRRHAQLTDFPTHAHVDLNDLAGSFGRHAFTGPAIGQWYVGPCPAAASEIDSSEAVAVFAPIFLPVGVTLDRIGANVNLAGAAGATIRYGIYAAASDLSPGALMRDGGTTTATSTGLRDLPFTPALALPAGLYWRVAVSQGTPATRAGFATEPGGAIDILGLMSSTTPATPAQYARTGVSGALPDPAGASIITLAHFIPRIGIKRSA